MNSNGTRALLDRFISAYRAAPLVARVAGSLMVVCAALLTLRGALSALTGVGIVLDGGFMPGVTQLVFAVFPVLFSAFIVRGAFFFLLGAPGSRIPAAVNMGFAVLFGVLGGPFVVVGFAAAALGLCFVPPVVRWAP